MNVYEQILVHLAHLEALVLTLDESNRRYDMEYTIRRLREYTWTDAGYDLLEIEPGLEDNHED